MDFPQTTKKLFKMTNKKITCKSSPYFIKTMKRLSSMSDIILISSQCWSHL